MAVSLARAQQCIGRRVLHENKAVRGTVVSTDMNDVWVKTEDGDLIPCIPAHLSWVSTLSENLITAIRGGMNANASAQVRYAAELWTDDPDDESLPGLGVVYSPDLANDDDRTHPLYVVAHGIQRVYPVRINALPDTAWEIEEVLGWATV